MGFLEVGVQIPPGSGAFHVVPLLLESSPVVRFASFFLRAVSLPHILKTFVHQEHAHF